MVPTDPGSIAQARGGDSSRDLMIPRPGVLALWKLRRNCDFIHVVCERGGL